MARKWDITDILHRLSMQTLKNFEWVVIDFYYAENKEAFASMAAKFCIKMVHCPNVSDGPPYMRSIACNRNEALVQASGDIIIFLDDYTAIDPVFVERHADLVLKGHISCGKMHYFFGDTPINLTGTDGLPAPISSLLPQAARYEEDSRVQLFVSSNQDLSKPLPVLGFEWTYTGNLAFSREVAERLNGFDPRLSARGEDGDFGLRANALGYSIMFNPGADSVNLSTDGLPCKSLFDHDHRIDFFLENAARIVADPDIVKKDGYYVVMKYGTEFVLCNKCGAEFMLNPANFIYRKLREGEFVVDKKLFNLVERRT